MRDLRERSIVHPVLFAVFPVLFLLGENVDQGVTLRDVVVPLLLSVAGALVVFGAARLLLPDGTRAGLVATLLVVLFFSFGHVHNALVERGYITIERRLLVQWLLLAVVGIVLIVRLGRGATGLTRALNVLAAVLVILNLVPVVLDRAADAGPARVSAGAPSLPGIDPGSLEQRRDIYYLIFDRYANERALAETWEYDNTPFLRSLEDQGFYVGHDSAANYPKTTHSLASSLNMNYLDELAGRAGRDSGDWDPLWATLRGFKVASVLQGLGYRYHHIGTWWTPTREDPSADVNHAFDALSEFSSVLRETTAWPAIARAVGIADQEFERQEFLRATFQFDQIAAVSRMPEATFTFAHFLMPHPPYVFRSDGSYRPPDEAMARSREANYIEQLRFANARIEELVSTLLAGPDDADPIVIIQSDEGPHPDRFLRDEEGFRWPDATDAELQEKLLILNAYYLPGLDDPGLYPTISPVNTFRLVFNEYFGADLPLLEDRTWVFEDEAHPYRFTDVTARLRAGA